MSRRTTEEEKITTYFQTAEAVESLVMFRVIKSILASRGFEIDGRKTVKKPKAAGKRAATLNEPKAETTTERSNGPAAFKEI